MTDKDKTTAIQIKKEHMEKLIKKAAAKGISVEEAIEQAMGQWLKNKFGAPN
jgi:methanogenic corrinoid protein MtbC1